MGNNLLERYPKTSLGLVVIIILLFFEIVARQLVQNGYLSFRLFPAEESEKQFWGDLSPGFGRWHYPNRTVRHHTPCFDVSYTSNSYGARDVERPREASNRRAVILGDSFVEGFGVNYPERMTSVAEALTEIELLNFGTSGHFSSTQQWLLYRDLAGGFDHSEVYLFLLPDNDFLDNDPANFSSRSYRPYLRRNAAGQFEVYHTVDFEDRHRRKPRSKLSRMKRRLYNSSYLLNLIRQTESILKERLSGVRAHTYYDDFDSVDLAKLLFGYDQIVRLAGQRPVNIVVIPRLNDLRMFQRGELKRTLIEKLEGFASAYPNVRIHDLLPAFLSASEKAGTDPEDYFMKCDGHWSIAGNKLAGEILATMIDPSKSH